MILTAQSAATVFERTYPSALDSWFPILTLKSMEVQLTPDQKALVREAIDSGRLLREEDAVKEALFLWEERERRRLEILLAVDRAEASLAHGEGRRITAREEVAELAADIRRRGMARLAAEQNPR
jgi:Arc/MetJ-type ribon-helix-helix transcriptional regulator